MIKKRISQQHYLQLLSISIFFSIVQEMGGGCPVQYAGRKCIWRFNTDCKVNTCTLDNITWSTFAQCSKNCCAAATNTYLGIFNCEDDKLPLILGLTLGLGYPAVGLILWMLLFREDILLAIGMALFWPFIFIGLFIKELCIGCRCLSCNCSCDWPSCDCFTCDCYAYDSGCFRYLCVIPTMIFYFVITILGFMLDLIFFILSLGIIFCGDYKSYGMAAIYKWKEWLSLITKRDNRPVESESKIKQTS